MSQQKNGALCEYNKLRRPRYFPGMLLDEKDFAAEQSYHIEKRRLLNRMLHGSGVVCGLDLDWKPKRKSIKVYPGLALDCLGNEIWVTEPYTVDLEKLIAKTPSKKAQPCPEPDDRTQPIDRWLCVYYHEVRSDPEPAYGAGDCKGQTCDFSRWKEGFCFKLVDACPELDEKGLLRQFCECGESSNHPASDEPPAYCPDVDCQGITDKKELCKCWALAEFCSKSLPCPDCGACGCEEHCVVLGKVTMDANGCLVSVCINDCRTYVLSGRMLQHLTRSLFAGIEAWTEDDVPSTSRLVENPIYGLCWLLRRFALKDNEWRDLVPPWIRQELSDKGKICLGEDTPTEGNDQEQRMTQLAESIAELQGRQQMRDMDVAELKRQVSAPKGQPARKKQEPGE